jgi:DNA repair protein RecN (Recombination protein N)
VIAFGRRCREELDALGSPEEQERLLEERRAVLATAYLDRARALSRRRRAAAVELRKRVQAELAQLAMEKTRFDVAFEPASAETAATDSSLWTEHGLETAEFLLSPNPGEELRPLARIASGGELSRLMLALKSVVGQDAPGLTLVFDEVDAGIGGRVAEVVGRKLKNLATRRQVLCVTHLPQIAGFADQHLAVRKRVERGRTVTLVERLAGEDRIEEVARMLGGETITAAGREHAREMLKQNLRG